MFKNILSTIALLLVLSFTVNAQVGDYNKLIKQTQFSNTSDGKMQIVWWIPI